jgi:SAM-dependent methyltransferase
MRITYRNHNVKEYWTSRWDEIPADEPMENTDVYPLKYAEETIKDLNAKVLEAGCGAGRILRYYHNQGVNIIGMDFIEVAIDKLKEIDYSLKVEVGDITNLGFDDQSFKYILAFGLYHNLEFGLDQSIKETHRVLESGGSVCASFRADNIQTRLTDWLTERRTGGNNNSGGHIFHKMNLTRAEFGQAFKQEGFIIDSIAPVENMPILYKFSFFRASNHKQFNENIARAEGYRLSWFGQRLQNVLMHFYPDQFCNIFVLIAHKK